MNPIAEMMKRYIRMPLKYALPLLFIGALVLVSTTGCTTTNTTQNIGASGSPAANAGVSVNLQSQGQTQSLGEFIQASSGHTYAVYQATIKNINAKNRDLNEFNFKLTDTKGNVYNVDLGSTAADGAMKSVTNTQPGEQIQGTIAFLIPQGATPKTITYDDGLDSITTNL
jgi:hypothetical protein